RPDEIRRPLVHLHRDVRWQVKQVLRPIAGPDEPEDPVLRHRVPADQALDALDRADRKPAGPNAISTRAHHAAVRTGSAPLADRRVRGSYAFSWRQMPSAASKDSSPARTSSSVHTRSTNSLGSAELTMTLRHATGFPMARRYAANCWHQDT